MKIINLNLISAKKQSGVILILALVILLILTMLMVSSMNATNMQLLMTGNTQFHTQAMSEAENALRFAENSIPQFSVNVDSQPVTGFYNLKKNKSSAINFSNFEWSSSTAASHNNGTRSSLYVIEYTGLVPLRGASIAKTQNNNVIGDEGHLYRITAQSKSARGAVRLVQSVYVSSSPPL